MPSHRYHFAAQFDWARRTGFYLSLENDSTEPICRLDTLRVAMGIGDGNAWRFIVGSADWDWGKTFALRARITQQTASLWINEKLVGESAGAVAAHQGALEVGVTPVWAMAPTQYYVTAHRVAIRAGSGKPLEFALGAFAPAVPEPVRMFNPETFWGLPVYRRGFTPAFPVTIEVTFRLAPMPDWKQFQPYIDRYGQCRYLQTPDKVRRDEDLRRSLEEERRLLKQWGTPTDYDPYGGYRKAGWREIATGFYRVVRRDGFWWLITPEGNPCFYLGVCSVPALNWEKTPVSEREAIFEWLPPREGKTAELWGRDVWGEQAGTDYVCLHAANLMRRFGSDWKKQSIQLARQRLLTWGFSGVGKWDRLENFPHAPVLNRWGIPTLVRHPDIFDPVIQAQFREHLRRQIEPYRNSSWVLGWSLGNEYDEIVTREETLQILRLPGAPAGKRALIDFALENLYRNNLSRLSAAWNLKARDRSALYTSQSTPPDEDVETLRRFLADRYYAWIYRTVKEIDPNHLYFGFWVVPGWWENEEDWMLSARHCDVLGYDLYAPEFADNRMKQRLSRIDKPVLCGEFSFPPYHDGARAYGRYHVWAKDEREAGELYARWVGDAAQHPACVGVMWFQYRDQPLTGRGPGRGNVLVIGEHYAFGLVDFTDRPKWEMLRRMREVNLKAAAIRLQTRMK
ncbi:MAG: glycosyl hydrolase [Firmicutes bacterium]|nr:glycosyl hydrolase [Bacillota bacterium]